MAAGDGLVTMTPTSIVVAGAGSSASINSDGGVDFTSATDLSLNGVFASGFDNYLMVIRWSSTSGGNVAVKLRASGTDATGSNYTYQTLIADGSATPSGARYSSETSWLRLMHTDTAQRVGFNVHFYGPFLAQPTAARSVSVSDYLSAFIRDTAGTHSLSTAYDGVTISGGVLTGNVVVFGYEE